MLIYSSGGKKIFHTEQCRCVRRMQVENIRYFHSSEEAERAGYHACFFCSKIGKRFRLERRKIQSFCQKTKLSCSFQQGKVAIQTPIDNWLVIYCSAKKRFEIYHQNTSSKKPIDSRDATIISGYHRQHWPFHSLYDTLLSIYDHTFACLNKPNVPAFVKGKIYQMNPRPVQIGARKRDKQKRRKKRQEIRQGTRRVLALLDDLREE